MRRTLITSLAVLGLVAGTAPAQAITWGQPDGDDHPHVVTLLFVQEGEGYYSCTGTLLDPDTVLTAGHCTEGGGQVNDETWVSNDPDPLADYAGGGIAAYLASSEHWVQGQAIPHPAYDDYAAFPDTYDIGLVDLDEPIETGGIYGTLPDLNFLEQYMTRKGKTTNRQVTVVGYGQQGTIPAFAQDDYERYQGTATIMGLSRSSWQGTQTVQTSNTPGKGNGSGGTCFGDSGGPAFWIDPVTGEETTTVVAITSYGITGQCAGTDFLFRTDTAVALDFVNAYA
ncbi:S1 family peptidase [Ornithinimicrobium cerasi]|uniref:Trypsin n=1 Tax=Ornithinimicrobium cerasi TaxID=2248773 RepID=A0A285VS47_9MICO|nr:S1 family peptidase [Ornithinimicrobium cerasi]SOC56875.1 Trypsin [Ornithinimicrobium cerasi]